MLKQASNTHDTVFLNVKAQIQFMASMARTIRHSGSIIVRFSDNFERDAKVFVQRLVLAMGDDTRKHYEYFTDKQKQELIDDAKHVLLTTVYLPSDVASNMTGTEIHRIIADGGSI